MSWRHHEAVVQLNLRRPVACNVLAALCHHANEFTGVCWPSLARLEAATGLSRRSIQNALSELEAAKLVAIDRGGGKRASLYTLTIPGAPAIAQNPKRRGAPDAPPGAGRAPPGAGDAPVTVIEQSVKEGTRAAKLPLSSDWSPSPEQVTTLKHDYPELDLEDELDGFVTKSIANGELYADPFAAFRSWCRHGARFQQRDRARNHPPGRDQGGLDRLRARAAAGD